MWKTIEADGCTWQVRTVSSAEADGEMLEFQTDQGNRPVRRLRVDEGALAKMDEAELRTAYMQARPIGGDHYGRPGKQMDDAG